MSADPSAQDEPRKERTEQWTALARSTDSAAGRALAARRWPREEPGPVKRVERGIIRYYAPCSVCGGHRDLKSKSGKCYACWLAERNTVQVAPNTYKRECPRCGALISHGAQLCKSCETRRRHRAGIMTGRS